MYFFGVCLDLFTAFGLFNLRLHNVYVYKGEDSENSKVTGNG